MCVICGCNQGADVHIEGEAGVHEHRLPGGTVVQHRHDDHTHSHAHDHDHAHDHGHAHDHNHTHGHVHTHDGAPQAPNAMRSAPSGELVHLERSLLHKNALIAERNRGWFAGRAVAALNLMSSPGAGKTALLVRTLTDLRDSIPMAVIEGDQETSYDADRIRATGAPALQINTGAGCHLEADMLERALRQLVPAANSLLFIENVGNLVCPALFDLGEQARVVVLSVTEGDDKPLKYPHMFRSAQLMVTTKIDLAAHVEFDLDRAEAHARSLNPNIECLRVSSKTGEGLTPWYAWLRAQLARQTHA